MACIVCAFIKLPADGNHVCNMSDALKTGELRLSGNHTVTDNEMSGEPYSQNSGWINHSKERTFQVGGSRY